MTNPAFNPDDPRLTAFALGELDEQERAEFEQFLEGSEEAREALTDIQETIGLLKEDLASEPTPSLTEEQRAAVTAEASGEHPALTADTEPARETSSPNQTRRRSWLGVASGLTAMVAVVCLVPLLQPDGSPLEVTDELAATARSEAHTVAMGPSESATDDYDAGDASAFESFAEADDESVPLDALGPAVLADAAEMPAPFAGNNPGGKDSFKAAESRDAPASTPAFGDVAAAEEDPNASKIGPAQSRRRGLLSGEKSELSNGIAAEGQSNGGLVSREALSKKQDGNGQPFTRIAGPIPRNASQPGVTGREYNENSRQQAGQAGASRPGSPVAATPAPAEPTSNSTGTSTGQNKPKYRAGQSAEGNDGGARKGDGLIAGRGDASGDKSQPEPGRGSLSSTVPKAPASSPSALPSGSSPTKPGDSARPLTAAAEKMPGRELAQGVGGGGFGNRGNGQPQPERAESEGEASTEAPLAETPKPAQQLIASIDSRPKLLSPEAKSLEREADRFYGGFGRDLDRSLRSKRASARLPRSDSYNEAYDQITENEFIRPDELNDETRYSTFSVDVDTASYANVRRFLEQGQFPPKNAVRVEELINYFDYDYPEPVGDEPFSVNIEVNICPWQPQHRLARIGIQAKNLDDRVRPPTNLVFLIDTSGSMRAENKLPLVRASMNMLVSELTEDDQVSIVTYSSTADLKLATTSGAKKSDISSVIDGLQAGGSTNGAGGIQLAYDTAIRKFIDGGSNRVIICTDGDFNVGISDDDKLVELIQEKAASGVFLSVFGFGMGNLKDAKLEKLADKGNGQYGYIDSQGEAKKVFREDMLGTLYTVAKDVKARVAFNPEKVGAYRLVGYENRLMAARDFTDDTKDAGEIGAGHTVTALYEIIPRSVLSDRAGVGEFKYSRRAKKDESEPGEKTAIDEELFELELKYKQPDQETSEGATKHPVRDITVGEVIAPSNDFKWAATVAAFGMNLRESKFRGDFTFREVLMMAQRSVGDDENGRRKDFIKLVTKAARLAGQGGELAPPAGVEGSTERPAELDATNARVKASADGKYRRLLKKVEVRDDFRRFGAFHDYGHWDGTEYSGHSDLLPGYWVYVYPNWYIWGQDTTPVEGTPPQDPGATPDPEPAPPATPKPILDPTPKPAAPETEGGDAGDAATSETSEPTLDSGEAP